MGPQVVVVVLPELAVFAYLTQTGKEIGVEQFAAQRAVKAFNIGILRRTCGLNPLQVNLLALAPSLQELADGFRAIVHSNPSGYPVTADQVREQRDDARGG